MTLVAMVIVAIVSENMAVPTSENANVSSPGQPLIDLGNELNLPHLDLTGKIINSLARKLRTELRNDLQKDIRKEISINMCRLHPCSEWSEWSKCEYSVPEEYGKYGGSNRTRNCGYNTTLCEQHDKQNLEYEFKVCKCRDGYTVTTHGYCIKYFSNKVPRDSAITTCRDDGGYLINIGSLTKMKDVNDTLQKIPYSTNFWMDGRRNEPSSRIWEFENQMEDPTFSYWHPDGYTNGLCMAYCYNLSTGTRKWHWCDSSCTSTRPYMCEIVA